MDCMTSHTNSSAYITIHNETMQCHSFNTTKDKDTTCFLLLAYALPFVNVTNQTSALMKQACYREWGSWMTSVSIAMCMCTGVVHNFATPMDSCWNCHACTYQAVYMMYNTTSSHSIPFGFIVDAMASLFLPLHTIWVYSRCYGFTVAFPWCD